MSEFGDGVPAAFEGVSQAFAFLLPRSSRPPTSGPLFLGGIAANVARFLDHQMITNKKDALGTELISVPFRQEEMEAILEDIES